MINNPSPFHASLKPTPARLSDHPRPPCPERSTSTSHDPSADYAKLTFQPLCFEMSAQLTHFSPAWLDDQTCSSSANAVWMLPIRQLRGRKERRRDAVRGKGSAAEARGEE